MEWLNLSALVQICRLLLLLPVHRKGMILESLLDGDPLYFTNFVSLKLHNCTFSVHGAAAPGAHKCAQEGIILETPLDEDPPVFC